jgi:acyl-CoA synthetase (AMP-forming)/AMP-acid ligase II
MKVPKEFHLLDFLPRTSIGKVQKGQLRTQARELWRRSPGNVGGKNPA